MDRERQFDSDPKNEHEKSKSFGTVAFVDAIGCFIQPDGDPQAVVNFPENMQSDWNQLPNGLKIGDKVEFISSGDGANSDSCKKTGT